MANTKITSAVIEAGAILNTHIASGAISSGHLSGINTAAVAEGTNLYYTDTRARASISVTGGNLSYDNLTGVIQLTDSEIRDAISATSSGDGLLTYTAGTGVIAYTGPTASEVQAHLSAGTGVTYSGGQFSIGQAVGTSDTVSFGNITTAGYLRGPANFTIDPAAYGDDTGTLIIAGNLQVDGTTTTINSTTLTIDDKKITLAEGAGSSAAANESGIEIGVGAVGASSNPSLLYASSGDKFVLNKGLNVGPITSSGSVIASGNSNSFGNTTVGTLSSGAITSTGAINLAGNIEGTGSSSAMKAPYIQATNAAIATYGGTTPTFHSPASGTAAFSMNGGERMRIDSSGNVGIDNNSPAHRLHIQGNTNNLARVRVSNTAGGQASLDLNNSEGYFRTYTDNGEYRIYDQTDGVNRLCIDTSGNIGIGDDVPQDFLEVRGASSSLGGITISNGAHNHAALSFARSSTATARIFTSEPAALHTSALHFQTSNASGGPNLVTAMTIDESQNVGIGTTSPNQNGGTGTFTWASSLQTITGSRPTLFLNGSSVLTTLRMWPRATDGTSTSVDDWHINAINEGSGGYLSFAPQGGAIAPKGLHIKNTGNVGIGTTSPSKSLSVKAPSGSNGGIDVFHNNGNKVAELVHHGSGDEGRLSLYDGGTGTVQLHGETGQPSYINSGNVGIGTTSPTYKFDVYGTDDITMRIHRPSSALGLNDTCGIGFSQRGDTNTSSSDTRAAIVSTYNGSLHLCTEPGGNLNSNPADHAALSIIGTTQNVGIGTTSPNNKLHVKTSAAGDIAKIEGETGRYIWTGTDGSGHYIEQVATSATTRKLRIQGSNGSGAYTQLFIDGGNQRIYTNSGANVALGTTSPDSSASMGGQTPKLTVDGYTSLDGLRVAGSDTGNTIYKTGGNMGIVSASHALNASGNTQLNLSAGGNTMFRGTPNHWSLGAGSFPHGRIRTFHYHASLSAGQTVALLQNQSAHTDVNFIYWIEAFHSSRSYRTGMGTFGGYGMNKTSASNGGLDIYGTSAGTGLMRLDIAANSSYATSYHISMLIFGDSGITVHNGTMSDGI